MQKRESEQHMQTVLAGIANRASIDAEHRFGGLYSLLNKEFLRWSFYQLNRKASAGIDEITWSDYESDLDENLDVLVDLLKRKAYRTKLVKRHYIPKGNDKFRPLGIPVLEDKLVQYAAKTILEQIYEADFTDDSFAYRPKRSAKQASWELCRRLQFSPVTWVVEADIKGFFDHIDHDWMIQMLEKRVHDRAFSGLIRKWLKAGILEDLHTVIHPEAGTPQGGVISPVLANIYLHYVLDKWFEKNVKAKCKGEAFLLRYADDFVCAFRYKGDAERFYKEQLPQRLSRFSLELAPDKTRLIRFTRYDAETGNRFDFLGFEFRWDLNAEGKPQVKRRTSRAKQATAMAALTQWIKWNRSRGLRTIMGTLKRKLQGHYNYYGVHHNLKSLWQYWFHAMRVVFKWLNRRSQRRSFNWDNFNAMLKRYAIPYPKLTETKY